MEAGLPGQKMEDISQKDHNNKALECFHRNLVSVLKRRGDTKEAVSMLEAFGPKMTGIYSLGDTDSTDRSYLSFIKLLSEHGIPYVEVRINTDGTPNESAYILYDLNEQYFVEELRLKALDQALNYRFTLDGKEAEERVASSDRIKDKNLLTIKGLNYFEKELMLERCREISQGYLIHEEERADEDGTVKFDLTVRDSKVLTEERYGMDLCKVYLQTMISLYGYNGNKIVNHLNAELNAKELIDLNVNNGNTVYVVGANEGRIKHYIEINPDGFTMFSSTMRDGKRLDAYMKPQERYRCRKEDEMYEEHLLSALRKIPSKTVLTSMKELSAHLRSKKRNIESLQPEVGRDEYIAATREKEMADIIDEAIRERSLADMQSALNGEEKFEIYKEEASNILTACVNGTIPKGYDPSLILTINSMLDEAGIDKSNYEDVPEAISEHEAYSHEAEIREVCKDREEVR